MLGNVLLVVDRVVKYRDGKKFPNTSLGKSMEWHGKVFGNFFFLCMDLPRHKGSVANFTTSFRLPIPKAA